MNSETVRARIEEIGIIPAIRLSSASDALFAADAVAESGIPIIELTMTVPEAIEAIRELVKRNPDHIVGGGTVFDINTAQKCIDAGATFLTSPGLELDIVEFARTHQVLVFPGALTPTEVRAAWKAGSDLVKVFPCSRLGGPSYIRTLKHPFPDVPLIASGGITQENAADFILAGAAALGIGRSLVDPDAILHRNRTWIQELSHRFVRIVKRARRDLRERNGPRQQQ